MFFGRVENATLSFVRFSLSLKVNFQSHKINVLGFA